MPLGWVIVEEAHVAIGRRGIHLDKPQQLVTGVAGTVDKDVLSILRRRALRRDPSPVRPATGGHEDEGKRGREEGNVTGELLYAPDGDERHHKNERHDHHRQEQPGALIETPDTVLAAIELEHGAHDELNEAGEPGVKEDRVPLLPVEVELVTSAHDDAHGHTPYCAVP